MSKGRPPSSLRPSLGCMAVKVVGARRYTQRCGDKTLPGLDRCKDCFLRLDSKSGTWR